MNKEEVEAKMKVPAEEEGEKVVTKEEEENDNSEKTDKGQEDEKKEKKESKKSKIPWKVYLAHILATWGDNL